MKIMYKKVKGIFTFFLLISMSLSLVGCDQKQNAMEKAIENKERLESIYKVEYNKTSEIENADNSVSISIIDESIKEKDGLVMLVYYNLSLSSRSYILYFNHDKSIPARIYYPVEPSRMLYEDKKEYEDYKKESESAYQEILTELDMTSDDLFDIARYVYENE